MKLPFLAVILSLSSYAQEPVVVRTDYSSELLKSRFQLGVTHATDAINSWGGDPAAISRMMHYLEHAPVTLQNTHIMGWGAGNPNPEPGVYNWSSLDYRINRMRENDHAEIIITFCTAPGWMKTSGEDWEMNDRVADEHFADYAHLCRKVATRYPDVKYFQVWNEFKGFWNKTLNDWDVARYTEFYNMVYDSVRSARPDAVIGGFYKGFSDALANGGELTSGDLYMIETWLEHHVGADFIAFDGSIHGWPHVAAPEERLMEISSCFGKVAAKIREKTDLPIWVSEYYAANMVGDVKFQAANHASAYYHSLINGTSVGLHWDPFGFSPLFTDPSGATGAQPTIHYDVTRYFNRYFGPGRRIYRNFNSDSLYLEVLTTATMAMLINKRAVPVIVELDGNLIDLDGYEIRLEERTEKVCMIPGESRSLGEIIYPVDPADSSVQWSPGNGEVISVDGTGTITALATGTAEIVVTCEEAGFTDPITLLVEVRNMIPCTVRVNISGMDTPPWFNTMYLADREISGWEFVPMIRDPENEFIYYLRDTLEEGTMIRPTFAFGNSWGTAENPPSCAQERLSSRTREVSSARNDFVFSWDLFDCTDALDPSVLDPDPEAQLQFNLDQALDTVPGELLGQQLVYCYEPDSLWSSPDGYLFREMKALSAGIFRYPGGVTTNYYHWDHPTGTFTDDSWAPGYDPGNNADPEFWMSLDEYLHVCNDLGITPLLGVNIESGRVYGREQEGIEEAAALAAHLKTGGFEGAYYYIGNEPWVKDKNGVEFSAAEYAGLVVDYGSAILAEDPEARLIVGWKRNIAEGTEELQEIFCMAGDYINMVDVHWYWNTSQSSMALWRNQQGMTTSAKDYMGGTYEEEALAFKDLVAGWGYPDVKLATLEYNAGAGNTYTGPSGFEISLMVGEMLMQFMNGGVDMACLWPTHFPFRYYAEHYNARTLFDHRRSLDKNAMYDLFRFMKEAKGKKLLGSYTGNDWIYSVVLQDTLSERVDVLLLNRADTVIQCILPLTAGIAGPENISGGSLVHYVDGPAYRADTTMGSFRNLDGTTAVDLPPFSITRVRLPGTPELYDKFFYSLGMVILDQAGGDPIPGGEVQFGELLFFTGSDGKVEMDSIPYGRYDLRISVPGFLPLELNRIEIVSDTILEFTMEEDVTPVNVTFRIRDGSTDNPIYRAQLSYQGETEISDSDGEIILPDAKAGILEFIVEHSDYFIYSDSMIITGDTILAITLCPKLADIRFEVGDTAGPLTHIPVLINDIKVYTDASGLAWISNQPARMHYTYGIELSGYRPVRDSFFLETDTTITIRMETLTGILSPSPGSVLLYPNPADGRISIRSNEDVSIQITGLGGQVLMVKDITAPAGEIDVTRLPEGFYLVRIRYRQNDIYTHILITR